MFIQEVSIVIKDTNTDRESVHNAMCRLIGVARKNGQAQSSSDPVYFDGDRIVWIASTLEKKSLAKKNDNVYMKQQRRNIEKWCKSKLQIKRIGENPYEASLICTCKKPSAYILFTNYITRSSPLSCGDCNGYVPLYRVPKSSDPLKEQEYYGLGCWESAYQACDTLQMECGFGERWGTQQLQSPDSGLSKEGRETGKRIEELTGTSVYYYLYNSRNISIEKDKQRKCPGCGGDWLLEEPWHHFYDFRCYRCLLVSNITFNSR